MFSKHPELTKQDRKDLDSLASTLLSFAEKMVKKHPKYRGKDVSFYPFAAYMNRAGKVTATMAYDGEEHPKSKALADMLFRSFQKEAKSLRAAGICYDARVVLPGERKKTDAIKLHLEHSRVVGFSVCLPYRKGPRGGVQFGELFATEETPVIFEKVNAKARVGSGKRK